MRRPGRSLTAAARTIYLLTNWSSHKSNYDNSYTYLTGHKFDSNQKHYQDDFDPFTSMPAAKCLAGWMNYYANVYMPNMSCLNVSDKVINELIDQETEQSMSIVWTFSRQ
jgi:hypothetical protein